MTDVRDAAGNYIYSYCRLNAGNLDLGKNRGCPKPEAGRGDPCDVTSGHNYQRESDYENTGLTVPRLDRHFSSRTRTMPIRLPFGNWTWSHTYDRLILFTQSAYMPTAMVHREDGRTSSFSRNGGQWQGDLDVTDRLVQTSTGWTYLMADGTVEIYENAIDLGGITVAQLSSITDRRGQTHTLTYDEVHRLRSVTGPFGHVLLFSYDGADRLTKLTAPDLTETLYAYDLTKGDLNKVTYPDGTARIYHYETSYNYNPLTGISIDNGAGAITRLTTFAYDPYGQTLSTEHAGGQDKFTFTFSSPTQTIATDALGNQEVFTLGTNLGVRNVVARKNLSDNKTLTQTFDANNNLTCKQDEEGRVTTWTYNATNQKTGMTEGRTGTCAAPVNTAATRTTNYQYLSPTLDLPTLIQSPSVQAGSFKSVTIGYTGKLPNVITQSGFTPTGAAVARSVTLGYNAYGQATSIDGPRTDVADVTTLTYYECTTGGGCGQLKNVTNALGHTTTYDSYDAAGRVTQITDPNGLVTTYQYDPRGRVRFITQGGRVTEYRYDVFGNVAYAALPDGRTLSYLYDAANYLRTVTDNANNRIEYGYDLKGNRTSQKTYDSSNALTLAVDTAFDARNRVSELNRGGSITKQLFDAIGNLTTVTDPNTVAVGGNTATQNQYDALNRLFTTVDRLNGVTQYGYDANNRVKTVAAPNGATTQYQYDDLGNLLAETSPDRGTVSYGYDAAGNLTSQTDARGVSSSYSYDALNRLTRIDYPGSTEDVTYTYDAGTGCTFGLGRLCAVTDESGSTAYGYDTFGNLLVQVHTELGVAYTTRYSYDAGNRVVSTTYPDNRVVTTPRDALGRIAAVTATVNGVAVPITGGRSYRPDGLLLSQSYGNGVSDSRVYDTQGRLREQYLASADTRLYAYDANGNLTGLQSLPLVGTYNYDALDRLSLDQRTTTATTSSLFTYDANGNRKTENTGTYAYLANSNRLSSTPQGSIALDAAGNTLSDGVRSYTYNNAGLLSNVAGAGYSYNAQRLRSRKIIGSVGTVYHYDLSGNLLAETDTAGAMKRAYVWADGQPLAQIEAVTTLPPDIIVDNTQATFTGTWATATSISGYYGANYRTNTKGTGKDKAVWSVSVPTTGTYQVYARWVAASSHASNAPFTVKYNGGSQTIAMNQRTAGGQWVLLGSYSFAAGAAHSVTLTDKANGTVIADAVKIVATSGGSTTEAVRYLHTDHLNTPRLATDASQQVVWRWEGTAFGATTPTGSATINLRFLGQYYDAETGLHYNWNRYYDPKIGRYITSDPIGLAGGLNTYAYVGSSPLNYSDPHGLYETSPKVPDIPTHTPGLHPKLICMDICMGQPVIVTATTNGNHSANGGHPSGQAVDIVPAGGKKDADKAVCCALDVCKFVYVLDEYKYPSSLSTGDHIHAATIPTNGATGTGSKPKPDCEKEKCKKP